VKLLWAEKEGGENYGRKPCRFWGECALERSGKLRVQRKKKSSRRACGEEGEKKNLKIREVKTRELGEGQAGDPNEKSS